MANSCILPCEWCDRISDSTPKCLLISCNIMHEFPKPKWSVCLNSTNVSILTQGAKSLPILVWLVNRTVHMHCTVRLPVRPCQLDGGSQEVLTCVKWGSWDMKTENRFRVSSAGTKKKVWKHQQYCSFDWLIVYSPFCEWSLTVKLFPKKPNFP